MSDGKIDGIAIIGVGAMGTAFATGLVNSGVVERDNLVLADVDEQKLNSLASELGARTAKSNAEAINGADVILVVVKAWLVAKVLSEIGPALRPDQIVIVIAAGVKLEAMRNALRRDAKLIRCMPNTPCRVGAGATGFARGPAVNDDDVRKAKTALDAVGLSLEVPEKLMDAVTGLSGSGPAYVYVMIDALSDAGVRVGLPRDVAVRLAAQTVMGAAKMVLDEGEHPSRLKDQVTTPGGTTIAGLDALEKAGFRSALIEAVKAATKRAEELG